MQGRDAKRRPDGTLVVQKDFRCDTILCGAGRPRPREDGKIAAVFSPFLVGRHDFEQETRAPANHLAFELD